MMRLLALALTSAALIGAANRPWPGAGYLAFVALVPLLAALHGERRWWRGALAGLVASFGAGLVAFEGVAPAEFWAYPALVLVAGVPWFVAGALFVLFKERRSRAGSLWFFVPLMVAVEFVPSQRLLLGDFANAINALGFSQFHTPLINAAGWSGVTGVSLLVIGVNYGLYAAFRRRLAPAAAWLAITVAAAVVPVPGSNSPGPESSAVTVAVVQGAVTSVDSLMARFDREAAERMLEPYANLTAQAVEHGADLVVWGETVLPHAVRADHVPDYVSRALNPAPVALTGGVAYDGSASYNSIFHWSDGALTEVYRKRALVPFNERHYTPGPALPPLDVNGLRVGLGVCLDSLHGAFSRESVRAGAEALVYVTEDSFAGLTVTPELHLRATAFRAAETGRYVVFANQSGPSAVINNRGRTVERVGHGEVAAIITRLPSYQGFTPFVMVGNWVGVGSTLIVVVGAALLLLPRRASARPEA